MDADVHVFTVEIGALVRGGYLDVDIRMQGMETGQPRHQPANCKGRRQFDAQPVFIRTLAQLLAAVFDLIERALDRAEIPGALGRSEERRVGTEWVRTCRS